MEESAEDAGAGLLCEEVFFVDLTYLHFWASLLFIYGVMGYVMGS